MLRDDAVQGDFFPKRLVLRRPTSSQLRDNFGGVRAWAAELVAARHFRVVMREVRHRVHGANSLPDQAWIDSADKAAAVIGKSRELAAFRRLCRQVRSQQPDLAPWLARKPIRALTYADRWTPLLAVVAWMKAHPRPGIYVRQMDVPGVDTKFVGSHRGVLSELLDIALPAEAVDRSKTGARMFEARYGFSTKPRRVRIRILDPDCAPLPWSAGEEAQDLTLSAASFAALRIPVARVVVTENETNFLALPPMPRTMAVFGGGYGLDAIGEARWLARCRLYYWGDIDTHGFAILDELRGHVGEVESLLMDRRTFEKFATMRVPEPKPANASLRRLRPSERSLYDDLRAGTYGANSRLEQERIGFEWVRAALAEIRRDGDSPASRA